MLKPTMLLKLVFIFIASASLSKGFPEEEKYPEKILICGVCQNVEQAFLNTKKSIEKLGNRFADYAVIIYENNSTDNTVNLYREWANSNPKVVFISENMHPLDLPWTRMEKIARARNIVLAEARKSQYSDFPYLIMADLDFITLWPIEEIIKSIHLPIEWDCISANGTRVRDQAYYDRYAFRDNIFCLGPELLDSWWQELASTWFHIYNDDLIPVFSAFGGLAIYKTATILKFCYSGVATYDLTKFYQQIFLSVPQSNLHVQRYLAQNHIQTPMDASILPVIYRCDSGDHIQNCCEHVPLHAAMYINGYNKFFINPKMRMYYFVD
jgi:hypothetical protein